MHVKGYQFLGVFVKLVFILLLLTSCRQPFTTIDPLAARQLKIADSLALAGKAKESGMVLTALRSHLKSTDPSICDYYNYKAQAHIQQPDSMNLFADSALAFFKNDDLKSKYPRRYFKALLGKGDAQILTKQYNAGLKYYYDARKVFKTGNCEDGYPVTKIAGIYYNQKNYKLAAKFWAESTRLLNGCQDSINPQKLFYMQQGMLNNSAISFEKAGMLDSAYYYYNKDLKLINDIARTNKTINVNAARIVIYDNLGGLNLKQGNYAKALTYITQCLAIPLQEIDGIKIPPLLKLAQLYLKTGKQADALNALNNCKRTLNRFAGQNPDLEILWNKVYAEYLYKSGKPDDAYRYQSSYIERHDSLENKLAKLYRLDVNRELGYMNQQQALNDLQYRNKEKKIYLIGAVLVAMLAGIIIVLINRNLKKSQKNQKAVAQHNQNLQNTLEELERVNKNYIRIMRVMAHDLRNPLSGITGLATMILDEEENELSDENKHMLKLIETTGTHSMEMISELLKSGLADENEPIALQMLDLKALLYDSVELLRFKALEKHQRILFESDEMPVMANVNHEKIWRVFNNLIVNAIKFSHENGVIQVGITNDEHHIWVSVADNGVGIAEKDKDAIFEMFTPAKKVGTNGEQPFGLGLSISKKIIEKHNGKIWFESNPGVGTVFYLQLPYVNLEAKTS